MRRHPQGRIALLVFPLLTGAAILGAPSPAHAELPTPVSQAFFDSTAGEQATGGEEIARGREIYFPTVQLDSGATAGLTTFEVSNPGGDSFEVQFAAPGGQTLVPGTYENAQGYATTLAGYPVLNVQGDGRGCGSALGRFVVDEATYDGSGGLVSFAARFEYHCDDTPSDAAALFGDLEYNSTTAFYQRTVSANTLDFSSDSIQSLTITNIGPSNDDPQGFTITGPNASDFSVVDNTCTQVLATNESCQVTLNFTPSLDVFAPVATLWFNDQLAPLGSADEAAGAGQGRPISLTATLSQAPPILGTLSSENIVLGASLTDTVTVYGNGAGGSPRGDVSFDMCGSPSLAPPSFAGGPCGQSLPALNVADLTPGEDNTSTVTSPPFTPTAIGTWCFSAEYQGDFYYTTSSENASGIDIIFSQCALVVSPSQSTASAPTTTQLGLSQSSVNWGSENTETFSMTVVGSDTSGSPQGIVEFYGSSILLCQTHVGYLSDDSAYAYCSLDPSQLAVGTYDDVYAAFIPDAVSSSNYPNYGYTQSASAPQSFSIVSQYQTEAPPTTTPTPSNNPPPMSSPPVTVGSGSSAQSGYDLVGQDGGVFVFPEGQSTGFYGSLPGLEVHVNDIAGMVPSPDDKGYFLVGSDGGVFAFGDAPYLGSLPGDHVSVDNIKGIVPTRDNRGYFLVGSDGGVFAFGDASYLGSLPGRGIHVNDIIGIAATPTDNGYWVVGANGTVYAFGSAVDFGSAVGTTSPVAGITSSTDGGGYWIVTQAGGVYPFGDSASFGSLTNLHVTPSRPVIGLVPTSDGEGYWLIGSDGGIFAFGDAPFVGSLPGFGVHIADIVGAVPTTL